MDKTVFILTVIGEVLSLLGRLFSRRTSLKAAEKINELDNSQP